MGVDKHTCQDPPIRMTRPDDDDLVRRLADEQIVLEVSPTSNICLGVASSYAEHPFRALGPLASISLSAQKHLGFMENRATVTRPLGRWAALGDSIGQTIGRMGCPAGPD